jgi:hypothetical protein
LLRIAALTATSPPRASSDGTGTREQSKLGSARGRECGRLAFLEWDELTFPGEDDPTKPYRLKPFTAASHVLSASRPVKYRSA